MHIMNRILSVLIGTNIIGMTIRALICFIIWFFVLPKFFISLDRIYSRVEFFLLNLILIEIIMSKISINLLSPVMPQVNSKVSEDKATIVFIRNLTRLFLKKPCFLFLHSPGIKVAKLMLEHDYKVLDSNHIFGKKVQVFKSENSIIVTSSIKDFKEIIQDESNSLFLNGLVRGLKKNFCSSITLVVDIDSLNNPDENGLLQGFYYCMYYLNKKCKFKFRLNVNLIIEDISKIEGFKNFINITGDSGIFNISYLGELHKVNYHGQKISENFSILQSRLIDQVIQSKSHAADDYQLACIFIQEICALKLVITRLIEAIPTRNKGFFRNSAELLISISLVNQQKTFLPANGE